MNKYYLGLFSEYLVIIIYMLKLHFIIHHRIRFRIGEIDIIARKGKNLVFIEVKARKNGIHEQIVSTKQKNRIINSAKLFLSKNPKYKDYNIRFDLVVVSGYKWPQIIENAW